MALSSLVSIGIIHTPHTSTRDMPIQPSGAKGVLGTVEIFPEYQAGLRDLEGFSHVILIYAFHAAEGYKLEVTSTGWLEHSSEQVVERRSDDRFEPETREDHHG